MQNSSLDYNHLVQDALRGVVATVLKKVMVQGLPGGHHFYIAFRTDHPGVVVPNHLRARYPQEITIVLQHQYWNLKVHDDRFEVSLSFNKKAETLVVPFEALSGFMDPSVQFGLQLQPSGVPAMTPVAAGAPTIAPSIAPVLEAEGRTQAESAAEPAAHGADNVVTLDIFRKNSK